MALQPIKLPLDVTLQDFQRAIQNGERSGQLIRELSITVDETQNQVELVAGPPPAPGAEIKLQNLDATDQADATKKMLALHDLLPVDGGVVAFGEISIENKLIWVAAFRRQGLGTAVAETAIGKVPRLPDFATNILGPAQGVPWASAQPVPAANDYNGLMPDTLHVFRGLQGMPNSVTEAVYYECKMTIDNDGSGGNASGDPNHAGDTSLHDANGVALNAESLVFAVLPLDASAVKAAIASGANIKQKKKGLPDFGDEFGLELGDLGVAFWREASSGKVGEAFFIYGDLGPANDVGEGSVQMANVLGINSNPNNGGFNSKDITKMGKGIVHVGFPGSGAKFMTTANRSKLVPDQVTAQARELWIAFRQQPQSSAVVPKDLTGDLRERVPIPPHDEMNRGLTSASEATMLAKFGRPGTLSQNCSAPNNAIRSLLVENVDVGPFKVSGMRIAVESLKQIFAELRQQFPRVFAEVRTDGLGMLCVRARRSNATRFSNHSWGTAIDLKFGDKEIDFGDPVTQRGFLALFPIFNKFGWFWGAAFSGSSADSMHFELSEESIRKINV